MQCGVHSASPSLTRRVTAPMACSHLASVLRCEAPEAFELLLLAQIDLDLDDMIDQRTKIPAVDAGRFDMGNHLFFNGSARWFGIFNKGQGSL